MKYAELERHAERHASDVHVARGVMPDGKVGEVVSFLVDRPRGKVNVQLRSERGRLVHDETKENFVSKQWAICARSWQRLAWGMSPAYSRTATPDWPTHGNAGPAPLMFPNDWIACWNDGSAEDPANEHMVKTDSGFIVAGAHKLAFGTSSGRRGIVNAGESSIGLGVDQYTFDWATNAGVGQFQSVGWTMLDSTHNTEVNRCVPMVRASLERRVYLVGTGVIGTIFPASYVVGQAVSFGLNVGGSFLNQCYGGVNAAGDFVILSSLTSSASFQMVTIAEDEWWGGSLPDPGYGGGVIYTPSYTKNPNTGTLTNYNTSTGPPSFCGEHGGFYWIAYWSNTANNIRIARMDKTTLALDRSVQANVGFAAISGVSPVGCIIGNDLFLTIGHNNSSIFRYDLTQNPPALTATITINWPADVTNTNNRRYIKSMITDGTDLFINMGTQSWTGSGSSIQNAAHGIFRLNTSGNFIQRIGVVQSNPGPSPTQNVILPSPADTAIPRLGTTIFGAVRKSTANLGAANGNVMDQAYDQSFISDIVPVSDSMFWKNGRLYTWNIGSNRLMAYAEVGWNLGSRVLLESPVTKSASQTMKIRYETTFPDVLA